MHVLMSCVHPVDAILGEAFMLCSNEPQCVKAWQVHPAHQMFHVKMLSSTSSMVASKPSLPVHQPRPALCLYFIWHIVFCMALSQASLASELHV